MARALWSGSISFGLVNIPVKLYRATRSGSAKFHLLHDRCGTRIKNVRWCPHCDQAVDWKHVVKGYEVSKGRYLKLDRGELDEILPKEDFALVAIDSFAKLDEIDPRYFDRSYYAAPDGNPRAYSLLTRALSESGQVAIARVILRTRSHLAALLPHQGHLLMTTLFYDQEVVPASEIDELPKALHADKRQLGMAQQLIESMGKQWDPSQYHDESGGEVAVELPEAPVVDLMEALKRSVAANPVRPAERKRFRRGSRTRPRPARASKP